MRKNSSVKTKNKQAQRRPAARKTKGGGSSSGPSLRLDAVRRELLKMKDDLGRTVHQTPLEASATGDPVDQASLSTERELLFELSDNERVTLDQIEAALRKIEKGTYGVCESCRKPIAKLRLKALPFARYCIDCQNSSESATVEPAEQPSEFGGIEDATAHELNS